MRIVLVVPPVVAERYTPERIPLPYPVEDLGLGYIAAYLRRRGHQVDLLSCPLENLDVAAAARHIASLQPHVVGISISFQSSDLLGGMAVADSLRALGSAAHIIVGGYAATFLYRYILLQCPAIDSACLGEGEETMAELVDKLEAGRDWRSILGLAYGNGQDIRCNPRRPLIADLDSLPFPERKYLSMQLQSDPRESLFRIVKGPQIETSRGCHMRCIYCAIPYFTDAPGSRWRPRSAQRVVDEVEHITRATGADYIEFVDDNFVGPGRKGRQRALDIADGLLERGLQIRFHIMCRADAASDVELMARLRQAGLDRVVLGVESGSQSVLDRYRKHTTPEMNKRALQTLQRLGINAHASYIVFDPYTTLEELQETVNFWQESESYRVCWDYTNYYNILALYPGTAARQEVFRDVLPEDAFEDSNSLYMAYEFCDPRVVTVNKIMQMLLDRMTRNWQAMTSSQSNPHVNALMQCIKLHWDGIPPDSPQYGPVAGPDGIGLSMLSWLTGTAWLMVRAYQEVIDAVRAGGPTARPLSGLTWKRWLDQLIVDYDQEHLGMPVQEFLLRARRQSQAHLQPV